MLVVNGYLENGVFIPEISLPNIKGRQKAVLNIVENERQKMHEAWREFSRTIRACNEELEGKPVRLRFKTPEDIEKNHQ